MSMPDEREFTNRNSPPGHRCCQNPLCLKCLIGERDNFSLLRYYPNTGERLFIVRRQDAEDAA
jgi:hypothetical protein